MTVRELKDRLDSDEVPQWVAYFALEHEEEEVRKAKAKVAPPPRGKRPGR
jgi:hypothetical protein